MVPLCPMGQRLSQLWIEPHGLDAGDGRPARGTPPAPAERLIDVVASFSLGGELVDKVIGAPLAVCP
jgi:hypothetical protein